MIFFALTNDKAQVKKANKDSKRANTKKGQEVMTDVSELRVGTPVWRRVRKTDPTPKPYGSRWRRQEIRLKKEVQNNNNGADPGTK